MLNFWPSPCNISNKSTRRIFFLQTDDELNESLSDFSVSTDEWKPNNGHSDSSWEYSESEALPLQIISSDVFDDLNNEFYSSNGYVLPVIPDMSEYWTLAAANRKKEHRSFTEYSELFYRKLLSVNKMSVGGPRKWKFCDKKQACLFCIWKIINLRPHFERKHKDEPEVKEFMQFKNDNPGNKRRRELLSRLRREQKCGST